MREIDLSNYKVRTDLVNDLIEDKNLIEEVHSTKNVRVSRITLNKELSGEISRKEGDYTTIYFNDITDNANSHEVLYHFKEELKRILKKENFKSTSSVLVVGLGNESSTADSLGVKTAKGVIPTRHIYNIIGSLEKGYRICSIFTPSVMGKTGIESSEMLKKITQIVRPDFVVIIDALAADSIDRLCHTIQITNTGINPGSGVGNNRKEITKDTLNIPVISIGVPMVVDGVTIVNDTINYMLKHFSYNINNENLSDKLKMSHEINYLNNKKELSKEEKKYFLGAFAELEEDEKKAVLFDVLSPVNNNLIVTPNDVDFILEKLTKILYTGINNVIHNTK